MSEGNGDWEDQESEDEEMYVPTEGGEIRCPVCGMCRPSDRYTLENISEGPVAPLMGIPLNRH